MVVCGWLAENGIHEAQKMGYMKLTANAEACGSLQKKKTQNPSNVLVFLGQMEIFI